MSIQPLPNSNHDANQEKWHTLLNLADILSTQFNLKSLLFYTITVLEQDYSCKVRIWLDPIFSALITQDDIQTASILDEKTSLMQQVYLEKRIFSDIRSNPDDGGSLGVLVFPLISMDQLMGVMQLEINNRCTVRLYNLEDIGALVSQFSMALHHLQNTTHRQYIQQTSAHLTMCEDISRSVFSNLDQNSLFNNILSLLFRKLDCVRVNIYTVRGDDRKVFKRIGISPENIEQGKVFEFSEVPGLIARSISQQEPVIVNNINLYLVNSSFDFDKNIQSELILPLLYGETLVGVLELSSVKVDAFGPETLRGFQGLAQNVALAIRNMNMYHSVQTRWELTERLQAEFGVLSTDVSLDDLLQTILDVLQEFFYWDAASIWLFQRSYNETELGQVSSPIRLAGFRIIDQSLPKSEPNQLENTQELFDKYINSTISEDDLFSLYPWLFELLNSKVPVIRNSPFQYEPLGAILGFTSDYSAIGFPLFINNLPIGTIVLADHHPDQYDNEVLYLAVTFARQSSIAIENIRLYAAAHDQAWISTVLLQVSDATQSITNLDEMLDTVVNMLPGLIAADACSIFLWDQSIESFLFRASYGFDEQQIIRFEGWEIIPGSVSAFDELRLSSKPVILDRNNLSEDIAAHIFPGFDFDKNLMILFPLTSQINLSGAILFDFSNSNLAKDSPQEIWDETYTLIDGAARQTAVAIENLQLIKSQEEEAYTSIALLQVAQAIVSFNQLDEILSSIVRITPILVGIRRCIIYLWDNKELAFRQSENFGFSKTELDLLGRVITNDEFPLLGAIKKDNHILYHSIGAENSPATWCDFVPGNFQVVKGVTPDSDGEISIKLDAKSLVNRERLLLGFPLSVKGDVLGVMLIEEEEPINRYLSLHVRERRLRIVKGITQQAAIAIQNELLQQEAVKSERMERELQLAREIQATFLPEKLPELSGWDIGARWLPAREVGGDFYDIIILNDDQIGFVIADVADKGMPAALFMTLIRTLVRAAAKEKKSPAAVLKQVNELMIPDSKHGMFVTVFYAVFSVSTGRFVYANAGHNPPLLIEGNQDGLTELTRTSIALGIFDEIDVYDRELTLNPCDWILFYTDGVTEAFSATDEIFGKQRLFDLLSGHCFISSNELLDRIIGAVNEFIQGVDLSDDVTLAAIYRKPIGLL
jgi:sigma-B regulation protein RsbU (phosphoserine phosphatase)